MSDVFISYARSTASQAQRIAEALRGLGYSVWRDDDLPAHRSYAEVIEERLTAAKAVVVVWSHEAARSEWVQSEADRARNIQRLVQVRIDDAQLPMPFDRIQCADLTGWAGDLQAHDWLKVVGSIADLVGQAPAAPIVAALPALPSRTSIAVVPFANLSNDPEQAYFVDGMVEDIVAALARFKSLFVISAGSNMVAGGKEITAQEAARQLGVTYVLEGSVRKAAGRVRVVLHLIDTSNGAEIWSDRLDDTLEDMFALQDRVAERVAGVLESTLWDEDIKRAVARPTANISSYDLYLRSIPLFRLSRKEEMFQSIELLDRAIELDPTFAMAMSQSCVCRRQVIDHGWCDDPDPLRRRALELADHALRLAGDDARVLAQVAASLPGLEGSVERAITLMDRAIVLNPASAFVWLVSGSVRLRAGDPERAAEHLETSIRLDPISATTNPFARMYLASARFQQGRFDDALALFRSTVMRLPVSYAVLASLYGHLGQVDLAREALETFRDLTMGAVEDYADIWFARPQYRKLFMDGIALAEGKAPTDAAEHR